MSLFPIQSNVVTSQQQRLEGPHDLGAWLSNNSSFQPGEALQPQHPYGIYATQADFLRAAERYLDSSSEDEDVVGERDGPGGGGDVPSRPQPHVQPGPHVGSGPGGDTKELNSRRKGHDSGGGRSASPSGSDSDHGGNGKKRKRKRSRSRSRDRKASRHGHKSRDGGKKRKNRDKKRRRRSSSSDRSDSSGGSSDGGGRRRRGLSEREKILRLERAAAAAGIAPRAAAALTAAAKPILRSATGQPGEAYFDTRGDVENLVYECLYGGNLPSYHRTDPLGLAKGARAYRLLPGQVAPPPGAPGYVPPEEEGTRGSVLEGRYFGGRAVAAERSRRLRRVYLSEAPVLPGAGGRRGGAAAGEAVAAGSGQRGWLMSRLEGPAAAAAKSAQPGGDAGVGKMAIPLPSFLPLEDPTAAAATAAAAEGGRGGPEGRRLPAEAAAAAAAAAAGGESAEEWVLRRTREFNIAVREAPHDVQLWLRFAAFQDTVARLLARRATEVAGSAAEKKLAILQRALEAHPGEPRLLRAMMAACEPLMGQEELTERWERLLRRTPGLPALWRDYLARRRSAFASTRLQKLQTAYGNAMHALASERARAQKAAAAASSSTSPPEERLRSAALVSELDRSSACLLLELLELELRAGASEVAVARLQALIEFHCFAPGALDQGAAAAAGAGGGAGGLGGLGGGGGRLPAGALLRLFDNFWEGGTPRVGEEGARGWANWYRQENESLWVARAGPDGDGGGKQQRGGERDDPRDGDAGGGWTGWMELPPLPSEPPPPLPPLPPLPPEPGAEEEGQRPGEGQQDEAGAEDGELPAEEEGQQEPQLTEEELLAALGLRLDEQLEEMQRQGVPPEILARWLRTERERSARDWQPLRPSSSSHAASDCEQGAEDGEGAPDAQRVVLLEEIRDGIFPLEDPDLKSDLILAGLSLLGVPLTLPAGTAADAAFGGAGVSGGSAAVGCCSHAFLRLLPPAAAVAACQRYLPAAGPAAALGAAAAAAPWCLQHESRRAFVARLLKALIADGPLADSPQLCLAYLLVEGSKAVDDGEDTGAQPSAAATGQASEALPCAERARQAARALLSERRNSVAALAALAAVEEAAGQPRAARRIRDAALAGAAALPKAERRRLPLLLHQYAEAERAAAAAAAAVAAAAVGKDSSGGKAAAAALEHALRAHHVLRWFLASSPSSGASGGGGVPYTPYKTGGVVTREDVAAARRGFEGGALDAASASTLYLGGLFEVLTARLFPGAGGGGMAAALTIFKHATAAVPAAVRRVSGHHEELAVSYCGLVVSELEAAAAAAWGGGGGGGPAGGLPPARARAVLLQSLELYPHNPALLALRVRLGRLAASQCRLRRDLAALAAGLRRAAEGSLEALAEEAGGPGTEREGPDPGSAPAAAAAVWWAQLVAEAGRPGSSGSYTAAAAIHSDPRVGRLLESAASARHLAPCAPVWLTYLTHEAAGGRLGVGSGGAKRSFLRAVREAPLDKELWLLGFALLGCGTDGGGGGDAPGNAARAPAGGGAAAGASAAAGAAGRLSSREVSELLGVAGDKGVRLRTDVYEVMLAHLAEQQE